MGAIGKAKYLWISNVLPMSLVDKLGLSVAGKKMELSLIKSFDRHIDCDVLSISAQGKAEGEAIGCTLWEGKKYHHIPAPMGAFPKKNRIFEKKILDFLTKWCEENADCDKTVVLLNSPLFVCRPLIKLKKKFSLKLFSITVDVPRLEKSRGIKHALVNLYHRRVFSAGHRALRKFDGLIGVNAKIQGALKCAIPFHKMLIGIDSLPPLSAVCPPRVPYKVAFAGTLIDYNGIEPLMDAIVSLDATRYELHIFGYGPLQSKVEEYAKQHENIHFHGQLPNAELLSALSEMDILVNPRVVNIDISDYTFPSKIVEYLATGKPVISTRFSSMPPEYEDFAFLIDQATASELAQALTLVTSTSEQALCERCNAGRAFVEQRHSYQSISEAMINFMKKAD